MIVIQSCIQLNDSPTGPIPNLEACMFEHRGLEVPQWVYLTQRQMPTLPFSLCHGDRPPSLTDNGRQTTIQELVDQHASETPSGTNYFRSGYRRFHPSSRHVPGRLNPATLLHHARRLHFEGISSQFLVVVAFFVNRFCDSLSNDPE